jgi:hypothetical protein
MSLLEQLYLVSLKIRELLDIDDKELVDISKIQLQLKY